MSHELEEINRVVEMAYLESQGKCWHGLGNALPDTATREEWLTATNMGNWNIKEAVTLFFDDETQELHANPRHKVLYRSDTKNPLGTVGIGYKPVQPREVMEFFDDIIESMGFKMSTAGVLFGGRKFWAQADIGESCNILGKDRVNGKLLLATACDGSLATTAQWTTTRVVCNNTLTMAVNGKTDRIKVSHASTFDAAKVKQELGLVDDSFKQWSDIAERMASREILEAEAVDMFARVFTVYTAEEQKMDLNDRLQIAAQNSTVRNCFDLFTGSGMGAELVTAKNTVWGAVNAVSEYIDHGRKTKTWDARFDNAMFGNGNNVKNSAWDEALLFL